MKYLNKTRTLLQDGFELIQESFRNLRIGGWHFNPALPDDIQLLDEVLDNVIALFSSEWHISSNPVSPNTPAWQHAALMHASG